jgi:colanic acid biosynthesis glycosyl transferase WcaI
VRILLVQRYFWPDVGVAASVLRAIATRLAADGHQVTVLSAMPSYNDAYAGQPPPRREVMDGFQVLRLRQPRERKGRLLGRTWSMALFSVAVAAHILLRGRRYALVCSSSTPPVLLTAAIRTATRLTRRPYLYHCQDLHPEAGLLGGVLRESWWTRLLARADRANVRRALAVVVDSIDMVRTLEERGLASGHVSMISNFFINYEPEAPADLPTELRKPKGTFRVLFAGNLGLLQGLDVVIEAAARLGASSGVQFAFVGAGASERALRRQAGPLLGSAIVLFPQQPLSVVVKMMEEADLGLVTLAPGVYRVAFPSKTMAYLEAGCPILAAVEPESQLAAFVRDEGVGFTCPPGDPVALAAAVERARSQVAPAQQRARIRDAGRRRFGRDRTLAAWSELFARIEKELAASSGAAR